MADGRCTPHTLHTGGLSTATVGCAQQGVAIAASRHASDCLIQSCYRAHKRTRRDRCALQICPHVLCCVPECS